RGLPELLAVGLLEGQVDLSLTATGPAVVLAPGSTAVLARVPSPASHLVVRRAGNNVRWEAAGKSGVASGIRLQPIDPGHRVLQGDSEYRGEFLVIPTPDQGGLTLINALDLESYLRGVVPWEIGRHQEDKLAALEAQAVAARTYTISHLGARLDRGFDVFASVMDQVYRGSHDEDPLCNQAVESTRGLILAHAGEPINAYYSACCGGTSSHIEEVWPYTAQPYLKSRSDSAGPGQEPFCSQYRYFNWRETWTVSQLEQVLQTTLPEYLAYIGDGSRASWAGPVFSPAGPGSDPDRPGALLDLVIAGYTTSGRVAQLDVTCDAGTYRVRGDRTRWVLKPPSGNPAILRSAMFEVELTRRQGRLAEVAARGRGYGHGIGLCQAGALAMAEQGYTFRQILAHYYKGARLTVVDGL
nr:SpoIID/LytB domain-containing protein [Candidatus Krumholzibacteria bacterium]